MVSSLSNLLLSASIIILVSSCTLNDTENAFSKKPVFSIESKDGNIVVHFKDNSTQSYSVEQVETLLKEKKIAGNIYQQCLQKIKEGKLRSPQQPSADKSAKEQYPYKLNGRDVYYVESKNGKFTIHLADKTSQSFSLHEIDCMLINHIITEKLYLKCMQKQAEESASKDSGLSFSYREIKCPEFN